MVFWLSLFLLQIAWVSVGPGQQFLSGGDLVSVKMTQVCVCVNRTVVSLCHPMDCSSPGSSVHGIFQARILERVAISFSRTQVYVPDC